MAKPELGTKRTCTSCGARFYDLEKMPVVCPKCEASFVPDILLPSKETFASQAKPAEKPAEEKTEEVKKEDTGDVEVVSLDEVEEAVDDEDDEVAAIADVDLGDDDDDDAKPDAEDNTFLVTDADDDSDVTGLIGGVASGKEDT